MRLVFNSTVISNFALVGHTEWLHKLWADELVTTVQVMAELQAGVRLSGTIGVLVTLIDEGHISREEADQALRRMVAVGYHSPIQSLTKLE